MRERGRPTSMRAETAAVNALALVVTNALLLISGAGLLALIGMVGTGRDLARMSGAAWLAGLAAAGIAGAMLTPFGVRVGWLIVGLPAVSVAAGWWRLRSARGSFTEGREPARAAPSRLFAAALAGITVAVGGLAFWAYSIAPLEEYDGWAIWGMKARALAAFGTVDPQVFASAAYAGAHLEYALGIPFLSAIPITLAGNYDSNLVTMQTFLIGVAGFAALWSLLRERVRPVVLWAWLAAIAATPAVAAQLGSGYADIPLAVLVAAGVVCLARWVEDRSSPYLALGALFLAAAALAKNEGVLFAAAAAISAFAVAAGRRQRVLLAGACVLATLVPWRVWAAAHNLGSSDYELSSSFDPAYVLGRLGRVPLTLEWFARNVLISGAWKPLPLIAIAAVLAGLIARSQAAVLAALFAGLSVAGLTWIYLISPLGVDDFLDSNGSRVIASVVVGTAALGSIVIEDLLAPRIAVAAADCSLDALEADSRRGGRSAQ